MKIGYFGTWERGYPRNDQVISSLRAAGADVALLHRSVWRGEHKFALGASVLPRLVAAELSLALTDPPDDLDLLLVGYPGQFDVWSARRHGLPVAFNAMVSLYDTFVDDRRRFTARSAAGRTLRAIDRAAFRSADLVIADTATNAAFFAELAGLEDDRVAHCYVGAEERLFEHSWAPSDAAPVLFVGKLIPLHGLPLILEAARLLEDVPFRIVGSGQEEALLGSLPGNVEHVPWVEYEQLPAEYARAACALGIFGASGKVDRVIPNKAFQALAVGTPLITADTPATRELLSDGVDSLLVERSPEALVAAIEKLRDPVVARRIGAAGRTAFERNASEDVLGRRWVSLLETIS